MIGSMNKIGQAFSLLNATAGVNTCKVTAPAAAIKLATSSQRPYSTSPTSTSTTAPTTPSTRAIHHHDHHHHQGKDCCESAASYVKLIRENLMSGGGPKRCLSSSSAATATATAAKINHKSSLPPSESFSSDYHQSGGPQQPSSPSPAVKAAMIDAASNTSIGTNAVYSDYETLQVSSPVARVLHIQLNRPDKRNALNRQTLQELQSVFRTIHEDKRCRAVIISGNGKDFSGGLDHQDIEKILHEITSNQGITVNSDVARRAKFLRNLLSKYQDTFNMIVGCAKPVIAVVHGHCLGAALNLICCTDIRIATQDSFFQLKDVSAGMMADMGVLQRMPKMVANDSWLRELALTARRASALEAKENGLISRVYQDQEQALNGALEMAASITRNSPVAVQGTKLCMNYSRDHTIHDGLMWALNWNMGMLQSDDLLKAMESVGRKHDMPEFDDM